VIRHGNYAVIGFEDAPSTPVCPALPSGRAAFELVSGDASAVLPTIGCTVVRAGLIAGGLLAVGRRDHLIRDSLAGAVAVELFVLGWALIEKGRQS
jgi:hypothetical protein